MVSNPHVWRVPTGDAALPRYFRGMYCASGSPNSNSNVLSNFLLLQVAVSATHGYLTLEGPAGESQITEIVCVEPVARPAEARMVAEQRICQAADAKQRFEGWTRPPCQNHSVLSITSVNGVRPART